MLLSRNTILFSARNSNDFCFFVIVDRNPPSKKSAQFNGFHPLSTVACLFFSTLAKLIIHTRLIIGIMVVSVTTSI